MTQVRSGVPVLGLIALVVLFLNLPQSPVVCKTCSSGDLSLSLFGAAYFAVLVAASFLFPNFPGPLLARGGLVWAVLLALALTWVKWPTLCALCLIGHGCNVLIWLIWNLAPAAEETPALTLKERLCLTLFAPLSVLTLFSTLNLTLLAHRAREPEVQTTGLHSGDPVPKFSAQTIKGRPLSETDLAPSDGVVLNFVSPDCPHCEKQLPILNELASELGAGRCRFVNVSPTVPAELAQRSAAMEWVEDRDGKLLAQFQVTGRPTLFLLGADGKIAYIIPGAPDQMKEMLRSILVKPKGATPPQEGKPS